MIRVVKRRWGMGSGARAVVADAEDDWCERIEPTRLRALAEWLAEKDNPVRLVTRGRRRWARNVAAESDAVPCREVQCPHLRDVPAAFGQRSAVARPKTIDKH